MSYSLTFDLYTTAALADLRAQLIDTAGVSVGAAVSTGFVEVGSNGMYLWTGTIPAAHTGGVKFYSNAASSNILGLKAINPVEAEHIGQIRAGVVGRSVANSSTDPTSIIYYDTDDATTIFAHTLTSTERTVA
jgi:hypothetical protein